MKEIKEILRSVRNTGSNTDETIPLYEHPEERTQSVDPTVPIKDSPQQSTSGLPAHYKATTDISSRLLRANANRVG